MQLNPENPFFSPFNTLHDTFPFERIKMEHFEEAFIEGVRRDKERIDKIVNNPEKPTFDNTILDGDMEDSDYYDLLDNVSTVFGNLMSAESTDEMQDLAQKLQPMLTQHSNDIGLNPKLFERIKYVHRYHGILSPEEKKLLDDTYDGFVRSGALLDDAGKERLRELTEEAGMLSLQFSENLLKERKAFYLHITDEADMAGLPETSREEARESAVERGLDGWVFTLDFPSYGPFMSYAHNRELRKKMYMAYNTLCIKDNEFNNLEICKRLINLRLEYAQLLGYRTYADFVLKERMAGSKKRVYKLLDDLIKAYKWTAYDEVQDLRFVAMTDQDYTFELRPWDVSYYSHKLKLERYNIDQEMLRPYLQLENVIHGVFGLATRLYGITFEENDEIQVYHPDVKAYEVKDKDGSFLAVFYADFHPRKGKQGGAWMTEYRGQWIDKKGVNHRPHVSVVMNLTKPTAEKPALLTLGEVETFLHEFGHALHGMFANTRFESLSGTNVYWDFVELPSQFMENYAVEKEFLRTFAFHYKTREPMPDQLIDRIVKSRNFLVAYDCMRQVSFSLLDMAYYTLSRPFDEDIISFEKEAWKRAQILPQLPDTCMTTQFSHIMAGGYSAGYYSYKWAEILDADIFSVFKSKGIFNRQVADDFRRKILSRGGTKDPMILYKSFRGKEPTIDALLKRNGITRK